MKLLVFGRTGQVARELLRVAPDAIYLGRDEVDLQVPRSCGAAIRATSPDAVINAAAWTAVDKAESEEEAAMVVNSLAPEVMAKTCTDLGIPLLHLSSDYVFDGTGTRPWNPTDKTAPLSAYGRTKLAGEQAVLGAEGRHLVLRTSWIFSAHGTNFVKTMLRLGAERPSLRVVADQIGGPTPAADIAATLVKLAESMRGGAVGGIQHYSGEPEISWAGFSRTIFEMAEMPVTVEDIDTADYPTPARRPLNSRLDCSQLRADFSISPPDWQTGLAEVLADLKDNRK
ncbi:dTDP-4-dehydrorhamnose reductase [Mesorhizobium sp. NPDC059054]|uniref:dTDP-4-dehydrorhamnose reductase n=1 Tax=Mesorhizobium sp. NPDC059054 TaxID=3346711 RepID=UPI00369E17CB